MCLATLGICVNDQLNTLDTVKMILKAIKYDLNVFNHRILKIYKIPFLPKEYSETCFLCITSHLLSFSNLYIIGSKILS